MYGKRHTMQVRIYTFFQVASGPRRQFAFLSLELTFSVQLIIAITLRFQPHQFQDEKLFVVRQVPGHQETKSARATAPAHP